MDSSAESISDRAGAKGYSTIKHSAASQNAHWVTIQRPKQCTFARTVRAHDAEHFTRLNTDIHVLQDDGAFPRDAQIYATKGVGVVHNRILHVARSTSRVTFRSMFQLGATSF